MEEFNGLKVPRPPTATIANYTYGCAAGCDGPVDWRNVGCVGVHCDRCIYHASNRKTLEEYLKGRKMEEFVGFIPAEADQLNTLDYSIGACALGCADNKDYERVGCCSNAIEQWACQECICYIANKKELEKYLEKRKMISQYRGCVIPPGLNKDNAHISEHGKCCCSAGYKLDCIGVRCCDCICDIGHKKELEELLKMWKEEENTIKPGMVVRFGTKRWCLVWSVDVEGVRGLRIYVEPEKLPKFGSVVNIPYEHIEKGYKLKSAGEYGIPSGQHINELLLGDGEYWEESYSPVLELTVEDVEEKFGRKVKIVGNKNA